MITTFTYAIRLRKVNKLGIGRLCLDFILNSERFQVSIGMSCHKDCWRQESQQAYGPNTLDINLSISKCVTLANDIITHYRLTGEPIDKTIFLDKFLNPVDKNDFLDFFEQQIEKDKVILAPGTYRHRKVILRKCKRFSERWMYAKIDAAFIDDFYTWIAKKGLGINARAKCMKTLKKYLKQSGNKKLNVDELFRKDHIRQINGTRVYLNKDEVKRLLRYYSNEFIPEVHKNVLQYFLFACFTGLRISDIQAIDQRNIVDGRLVYSAVKTARTKNQTISIKLVDTALGLLNSGKELFTRVYCDQFTNRELKNAAKVAGVNKIITFHVARHTFATTYLLAGGSLAKLQKLLGHSNIRETMIYSHVMDTDADDELDVFNNYLGSPVRPVPGTGEAGSA